MNKVTWSIEYTLIKVVLSIFNIIQFNMQNATPNTNNDNKKLESTTWCQGKFGFQGCTKTS